ncbi:MAG: peptidase M14, partial [Gemmatimonadetes bacterium]|nr:peptidase M14 [Gemmatimonadota bacterium]NIR79660.1 peptidase M14 [Gemmatimonadota bacterium]NIT88367.1 peptidase M14 [Gemmatimonadota bacterium]NIU30387.1 peptidase M14 [Gemmatimonadota bacterium]NIU36732.1 peptidase M14 [Gemmatimonadota bacterium]
MTHRIRTLVAVFATALLALSAPLTAQAPTPESVIGWEPGADYELADYSQIEEYFQTLDAASDRIELRRIGESAQGRALYLALISSAENLRNLDRWKEIARRLAMARGVDEGEARRLAAEGKAILWIDGGLHATEVAHGQMTPKLAHHLVSSEEEEVRRIREDAVVLVMPNMNPDGLDIVAGWYRRNLGTEFETAGLPVLYHEYVGHDNNRDWFMILQPESEAVTRQLWHEWFPQIVYNHHQTGPFPSRIFIPPFTDPMNPNIPAMVMRGINLVGTAMGNRFDREGKPGVVSRVQYSVWWNGGMRTAPYFHNQIGILTETNLYEYATPHFYPPDEIPQTFGGRRGGTLSAQEPSVFYPNPWKGGWWRIGDAVDYMMTGSMAVLDIGVRLKDDWLFGIWEMGRRAIEAGEAGGPYAYVIPREQWDAGAGQELVSVLRRGGVEVHEATASFRAGGRDYSAGDFVAYAAQPFRAHLMDLMEPQDYPDRRAYPGGPPDPPYDLAGWTLPMQMGVDARRVDAPFEARTRPVQGVVVSPPAGEVRGSG